MRIKRFLKTLLPYQITNIVRKCRNPSTKEYRWINRFKKQFEGKIHNEITITKDSEIYLKSDFGYYYLLDPKEVHLTFNTHDDPDFLFLLNYLSDRIPQGSSLIDVGAFMGGYSLALSMYFPESKIYCFEPATDSFKNLQKNLQKNNLSDKIFPYQNAISDKRGIVKFKVGLKTGNHITKENLNDSTRIEKVESIRIDDFVDENKLKNIGFIKVDVEGHELFMIKGAKKTLMEQGPPIYIEIQEKWTKRYDYNPRDLFKELIDMDYIPYIIKDSTSIEQLDLLKDMDNYENFLFLKNSVTQGK